MTIIHTATHEISGGDGLRYRVCHPCGLIIKSQVPGATLSVLNAAGRFKRGCDGCTPKTEKRAAA